MVELGWTDWETLDKIALAVQARGQDPDAFTFIAWCEAVAWK
jgi:hypothetical protein